MLTHYQSRIALGGKIDLVLVSGASKTEVEEIFRRLWLTIFEFEKRFSRFIPASELSQFNRAAGLKQPISPEFKAVLTAACQMSALSGGLYNPFVLPALQRAGYVKSMVAAHSDDEVDDFSNRSVVPPEQLEVADTWARIPYGTAIDIGGCGKGYAGDLLADLADTFPTINGYWFSLGGDVVTGGLDEEDRPWTVGIESVSSKSHALPGQAVLPGPERYAVATSSVMHRKGTKNGKSWHHIIDPRTGRPALSDMAAASICSRTALAADVLASCAVILGTAYAEDDLSDKGAEGGLLQAKNGAVTGWGELIRFKKARRKASK